MKKIKLLISFLLFLNCTHTNTLNIDISDDLIIPKKYVVQKTNENLSIDGFDKEIDWNKINFSEEFTDIENNITPTKKTRMKMLWDDNYLYVFAKLGVFSLSQIEGIFSPKLYLEIARSIWWCTASSHNPRALEINKNI